MSISVSSSPVLSPFEENAILHGWSARDVLVMLYGYFDESLEHGADGRPTRLTLGGFIGRWPEVEGLCQEWRAALEKHHLAEFHMREDFSDEANADRWPAEKRAALAQFADILCRRADRFCAFNYPVLNVKRVFQETYEMALARVMINAASAANRSGDRIRLVFAHTQEIKGELIQRYYDRMDWRRHGVQSVGHEMADGAPPLQAAEIVARGMKRLVQDGFITPSFRAVLGAGKPIDVWPRQGA